jgi:hypothetical protein
MSSKSTEAFWHPHLNDDRHFYWYNVHPHGSTHYQFTCSSMSGIR